MKEERVLLLGAEGGGFDFFRRLNADGTYGFNMASMGCGFDTSEFIEESETSVNKSPPPSTFATLEEAISAFLKDGMWVFWEPLMIHPDYRETMWQLRERTNAVRHSIRCTRREWD